MSYPIIAVFPPKVTEHPHIAQYIRDIRINPQMTAESRFMRTLTDYVQNDWRWWYDVNGVAATAEAANIINNHNHPQYSHFNRLYRRGVVRAEAKPSFVDYAAEQYDYCILTNERVPAAELPKDKSGYILLNEDNTDVVDIVVYKLDSELAFIEPDAFNRINEFVDKRGHIFTEGHIVDIDFAQLDQQIIDDSLGWCLQDIDSSSKRHIRVRMGGPLVHHGEDFDGDSFPDKKTLSPAMSKEKAAEQALSKAYGNFQVVKPDGQLLSAEGFGRNNEPIGKYIRDYLVGLPKDTYVKLYWG